MSAPDDAPPLDLGAIEARAKVATQGRWKLEREELTEDFSDEEQDMAFFTQIGPWEIQGHEALGLIGGVPDEEHDRVEADAAFMEQAVPDVLALVAEVRRAREEARLWRALALAQRKAHRSGWPSDTVETQRARMALRSAGIDPDAEDPST